MTIPELEAQITRIQNTLEVRKRWESSGRTLTVQFRFFKCPDAVWDSIRDPSFDDDCDYRIKPEPREWKIWEKKGKVVGEEDEGYYAEWRESEGWRKITVREVCE